MRPFRIRNLGAMTAMPAKLVLWVRLGSAGRQLRLRLGIVSPERTRN
jgi:hypothetical protein